VNVRRLSTLIALMMLITSMFITLTPYLSRCESAPVVIFTWTPDMPLANETVSFDASSSYDPDGGKIISFSWDFGDGFSEVTPSPKALHVYSNYGTYNVNLTIADDQGEKAWLAKSITIRWYPTALFTYTPERPLVNEIVKFDASASKPNGGTIVRYYWDFGDNVSATTENSAITHEYKTVGNFTVYLVVEDSEGLNSTAYSKTLTVIKPPKAEFTYSPSYPIVGDTVTFDASESKPNGGGIIWYYWNFGDGFSENTTAIITSHAYTTYGNYTVTLTIKDSEGLSDTASKILCVRQYPKATFTYVPALPLINETVTFNATESMPEGGTIIRYEWNFGDGVTAEGVIVSHAYSTFGTFTITLTVTDSEGLSNTCTRSIRIAINPVANFTYTPAYPVINQPVHFNASNSYDPDRKITAYMWDFGDGNITITSKPTIYHVYATADVYKVTLTVIDDDSLTDTVSKIIAVYTTVPTHDIAVVQVTPSSTRVVAGSITYINVTMENQGTAYETYTVTLYYDNTLIGAIMVSDMAPAARQVLKFVWNTTGVPAGCYSIKAMASVLIDEVDTADNIKLADQKVKIGPLVWLEVQPSTVEVGLLNKAFNVNVVIRGLDVTWRAVGVQFRLCYNHTLLQVTNVTEGSFLQDARWNLHGTFFVYYVEEDPTFGWNIIVGIILYPNETGFWNAYPYGDGVVATITFKAIYQERGLEKPPLTSDLRLMDTMIIDEDMFDIPLKTRDGVFKIYPTNIGDLDFNGKVDARDIALICKAFGSSATVDTKRWNPNYDINKDGKIDVRDIAVVCRNFGWKTVDP